MPLSSHFAYLSPSVITVIRDERQRRDVDTRGLEDSIRQIGLINPIVIRQTYNIESDIFTYTLVAGERRLQACKNLGLPTVPVRFAEDLSPIESAIIELEENIKRSDLPWPDLVLATAKIHSLYLSIDSEWTQAETAESLSLTPGTISLYLKVASEMNDPRISECSTVREAYNVIDRRHQRASGDALADLLRDPQESPIRPSGESTPPITVVPEPPEDILHISFLEWAPTYSGPKFNLIHVDFPFGIGFADGPQGLGSEHTPYTDDPQLFQTLLNCFTTHFDRFASFSCHVMFWHPNRNRHLLKDQMPFLDWQIHDLIWVHSDNAGISPDPRRRPRHIYDTCMLGSRGSRNLVKVLADAYSCPTNHDLHPSTKPEPMLRHFMGMLADEHTTLFDPTAGSASSLRAAESLGATTILGLESDLSYCQAARQALKDSRTLRKLSGH